MDLLRLGSSTLLNTQQALATTGHNISNANTEGYSRQRVNFNARSSEQFGSYALGQGANVSSITRSSDAFMTKQVQSFSSADSRYGAYLEYSTRLDDLMADANNSISGSLQSFFNGVQGVSSNPAGMPERQVMLSGANDLVQRLQSVNNSMQNLAQDLNAHIQDTVNEINGLSDSIRQVNLQIVTASAGGKASPPNDLLDRRDQLLTQLANKVGISVVMQDDGSANVFAGKGQALVVGNEVTKLVTRLNPEDSSKLEVALAGTTGGNVISQYLQGGELQGLMDFRERNMAQTQSRLGLLALTLSSEFNTQHQKGMDLMSNIGGDFFSPPGFDIAASTTNTGTTAPTVTVTDITDIKASDYRLKYDGSVWHLTRMSDNTSVSGTGVLSLDGMDVDTGIGTPGLADSFNFNPARDAADGFKVLVKDPRLIAAAAAVKSAATSTNIGKGKLDGVEVTDSSMLPLSTSLSLAFDPDALGIGMPGFVMSGALTGTLAYNPATDSTGKDFTLAGIGISFHASGVPQNGDTFTVSANNGAKSDNRNALALAGLQGSKIINGKQDTLQSFYASLVSDVGVNQQQADSNKSVQSALLMQAQEYRDSVSGVNLDEEAANMLKFQQAYQAAAQMIKIADEVFNTLLQSMR